MMEMVTAEIRYDEKKRTPLITLSTRWLTTSPFDQSILSSILCRKSITKINGTDDGGESNDDA